MGNNLKENPLAEGEKYAILSHKYTIADLTATGEDKNDHLGKSGYKLLQNVEMFPFKNFNL